MMLKKKQTLFLKTMSYQLYKNMISNIFVIELLRIGKQSVPVLLGMQRPRV